MKKQLIILLVSAMVVPALAQETNDLQMRRGQGREANRKNRDRPKRPDHADWTEEQHKQHQERKYQFMDKELTQIGVSDEDKIKIRQLQEAYRQQMKASTERTTAAREKLSTLQNAGASEAELYASIDKVAGAQSEHLKIIVRNRMEMEKILGKEKHARFMENARTQFRQHGRRGGSGVPPRPGVPPKPKTEKGSKQPPPPDSQTKKDTPPLPSTGS